MSSYCEWEVVKPNGECNRGKSVRVCTTLPVPSGRTWQLTSPLLPPSSIYSHNTLSCVDLRHWETKKLCESHAENQQYCCPLGLLIVGWHATRRPVLFSKILGLPHWINKIILDCLFICPFYKPVGKKPQQHFAFFFSEVLPAIGATRSLSSLTYSCL